MPQQVNVDIKELIKELKETAQHMTSLATLLENAEELSSLQAKMNQLLGNPALTQAITTLVGPQQVNPTAALRQEHKNAAQCQPAEEPKPTIQQNNEPHVQYTPNEGLKIIRGKSDAPFYKDRVLILYNATKTRVDLITDPVDKWSEAKARAVLENTKIHPDSITSFGTVNPKPWAWEQVLFVANNAAFKTVYEMTGHAEHDAPSIRTLLKKLNIQEYKPESPKPQPARILAMPVTEQYLPEEIQSPSPAKRLKICRLMCELTYDELAQLAGIKKKKLLQMENGSLPISGVHQKKLTEAMGLEHNALTNMPICDILDLSNIKTAKDRLMTLRLRFAMTQQEFANRLGLSLEEYKRFELNGITESQAKRICLSLKVGFPLFKSLFLEKLNQTEWKTTGEKLNTLRTKRGWTLSILAAKSGVSESYISQIEKERHNPSDTILTKLAHALNCTINDIQGDPNTGIRPIKTL